MSSTTPIVTLKTFNGTDIRRIALPAASLQSHAEIVSRICDVYGLEPDRFASECALEIVAEGWAAPRTVRSEADLRAVPELAPAAVKHNQLFRVRILVNFAEPEQPQQQPEQPQQQPEQPQQQPEQPQQQPEQQQQQPEQPRAPRVMSLNREAVAAIRESYRASHAEAAQERDRAKEEVKGVRQEVRALRMKLKEAWKQARVARVEGSFDRAKEDKLRAKETVKAARDRLMEAEAHLADCKGRIRRVKEEMRAEILSARTENAAASTDSSLSSSSGSDSEAELRASNGAAAAPAPASGAAELFQTGDVVVLQAVATGRMLNVVRDSDKDLTASGHRGRAGRFLVTRCDDLLQFQSRLTGSYLRIDKQRGVNARGSGGFCTWFRPVLAEDGTVALQSVFMEKTAAARVFLGVAGDGLVASDDATLPVASRFRVTTLRNIKAKEDSASSDEQQQQQQQQDQDGQEAADAPHPMHPMHPMHPRFASGGFGGFGFRHGGFGGCRGAFKKARIAELERENAQLVEENARLRAAAAAAPVAASAPAPAAPGSIASAPLATPTPTPTAAPAAVNGAHRDKVCKRRARAEEHALKAAPASLSVGDTVFLQAQTTQKNLRIRKNGAVDGNGQWGACAQLRVVGADGDAVQLTNSKNGGLYLRMGEGGMLGSSDKAGPATWFRIVRHESGLCSLQSVAYPAFIVGVVASGEAKALGDAGMNMDAPHGRFRITLG